MKSRLIAGGAAILLAIVGAILIVTYAQGADQRAVSDLQPESVLVVTKAVPAGSSLDTVKASVTLQQLPGTAVAETALQNLDDKAGSVAAVDLVPGEQLLAERLVAPEDVKASGAVQVPKGLQEVSFQLEPQRVVGGRISAGDHVGIAIVFDEGADKANAKDSTTQLTIRKALVTAVQRAPQPAAKEQPEGESNTQDTTLPEGSLMLTVAVSDIEANKIVFASEFGRLWLTKEPLDAKDSGPRIERKEVVYK